VSQYPAVFCVSQVQYLHWHAAELADILKTMKGYGQFCPIAKAAEIFAERWTPLVLRELFAGSTHFNDLRRGVPLMSSSLLSQRLKRLEAEGVIERCPSETGHGCGYHLTAAGRELEPLLRTMGDWGARWVRSQLAADDLDVGLLMWDMRRRVRPDQFPGSRVVVEFEFRDVVQARRLWWLISEGSMVDLCMTDPGYEVDLFVLTDLRTMTAVWMGDTKLEQAVRSGQLEVHGSRQLRAKLGSWFGLSPFAAIDDQRTRANAA
jgi:DNA-binding HxlR family transcriptional regulator